MTFASYRMKGDHVQVSVSDDVDVHEEGFAARLGRHSSKHLDLSCMPDNPVPVTMDGEVLGTLQREGDELVIGEN